MSNNVSEETLGAIEAKGCLQALIVRVCGPVLLQNIMSEPSTTSPCINEMDSAKQLPPRGHWLPNYASSFAHECCPNQPRHCPTLYTLEASSCVPASMPYASQNLIEAGCSIYQSCCASAERCLAGSSSAARLRLCLFLRCQIKWFRRYKFLHISS